jgi:hypothetical protein
VLGLIRKAGTYLPGIQLLTPITSLSFPAAAKVKIQLPECQQQDNAYYTDCDMSCKEKAKAKGD